MAGARHYAFTWFNYSVNDVVALGRLSNEDICRYIAVGEEVCPTTGRRHLQGAIGFNSRLTIARVKAFLGNNTIHVEPARLILRNYAYAIKGAASGGRIHEWGERPVGARGERKDLTVVDTAVEAIKGGMKLREFRSEFFGVYRGSPGAWVELIGDYMEVPEVEAHPLSTWQALLNAQLMHTPNPRTIVLSDRDWETEEL